VRSLLRQEGRRRQKFDFSRSGEPSVGFKGTAAKSPGWCPSDRVTEEDWNMDGRSSCRKQRTDGPAVVKSSLQVVMATREGFCHC
jgi:hypothetical protein